jgi:hypothetical protein
MINSVCVCVCIERETIFKKKRNGDMCMCRERKRETIFFKKEMET